MGEVFPYGLLEDCAWSTLKMVLVVHGFVFLVFLNGGLDQRSIRCYAEFERRCVAGFEPEYDKICDRGFIWKGRNL